MKTANSSNRAVASADNPAAVAAFGLLDSIAMDFQDVYQEFQPRIHRFLCRLVGPEEADDLAQDVFLKVSEALSTFRGESTLSTWVYRIATNSALDKLRSRSSAHVSEVSLDTENPAAIDRSPDAEHLVFRMEMRDCLDQYIETLQPSYRSVFVLSEIEGLTNPEIAQALGISLQTVKIRLHRARQRLQIQLRHRCHFSRDARNELICEPKSPAVSTRR
jgi:RNA polymerase sigma-70 factor (ECF subfamily)